MSVIVPGTGSNLSVPLSVSLKNFVVANWPTSGVLVLVGQIKFRNQWWDGYGSYQIHFLDRTVQRNPMVLGWQYDYASDFVDAHIFVRKNVKNRPEELDDIKRSLETLIMLNRHTPPVIGFGNGWMRIIRTVDVPMQSAEKDLWHSVVQIEIGYYLASTT